MRATTKMDNNGITATIEDKRAELVELMEQANADIEPFIINRKQKNAQGKLEDIGKPYAEVKERVSAFRKVYPDGTITTELVSNENGIVVFKATVQAEGKTLATGHANEFVQTSGVNQYNAMENCETSAVGRALGFCGFGIKQSIASADEMAQVKKREDEAQSEELLTPAQLATLTQVGNKPEILKWMLGVAQVNMLEKITREKASGIIAIMQQRGLINEKGELNNGTR